MGKLIVLEGTDGSGKSTQLGKLIERLESTQESPLIHTLSFPQYGKPSAAPIELYLQGAFGTRPGDVNPFAASTFYAVDRYASFKQQWEKLYSQGTVILADRYTSSNCVHQGAKCPSEEREAFFQWLDDLEHEKMGLPRPDLVLYLDMPSEQATSLLRGREAATQTTGDIHEVDAEYLSLCRSCGGEAGKLLGWKMISCVDSGGNLRSIADIHQEIWGLVSEIL